VLCLVVVIAGVALIIGTYGFSTLAAVSAAIAQIALLMVPIVFVVSSVFGLVIRN
jgi:uncharacterized membrane protein YtjA (UPF0391 family)